MRLFFSTFALIFLAELPDKTAFAALMLSAERSPLGVFIGAAAAFLIQTVIAVAAGGLIGRLPVKLVRVVGGLMFLAFAGMLWRRREEMEEERPTDGDSRSLAADIAASFLVIFAAEWGDITQLATAVIAAENHRPLVVGSAALLALWAVTGLAAGLGGVLGKRLEPRRMNTAAAVAFACVGALVLAQALR